MHAQVSFPFHERAVTLEAGRLGLPHRSGVVLASVAGTAVLATVQHRPSAPARQGLLGRVRERIGNLYWERRHLSRMQRAEAPDFEDDAFVRGLIERSIRLPHVQAGGSEVHIELHACAHDPRIDARVPALLAASAALAIAGITPHGIFAAARIGCIGGDLVVNPTRDEIDRSQHDLVVTATRESIVAVQSDTRPMPAELAQAAAALGHRRMQPAIGAIDALVRKFVSTELGGTDLQRHDAPAAAAAALARAARRSPGSLPAARAGRRLH